MLGIREKVFGEDTWSWLFICWDLSVTNSDVCVEISLASVLERYVFESHRYLMKCIIQANNIYAYIYKYLFNFNQR